MKRRKKNVMIAFWPSDHYLNGKHVSDDSEWDVSTNFKSFRTTKVARRFAIMKIKEGKEEVVLCRRVAGGWATYREFRKE